MPVLVIKKSTPFWNAIGSKFDFSTSGKIAKIANQQINKIWTHTHILSIAALGSASTANQQINAVRRPIGSKFYFSTIANQQINRVWTHTHILAMAALLDSASTANQRINSVLRTTGSKFYFPTIAKITKIANQQIKTILRPND